MSSLNLKQRAQARKALETALALELPPELKSSAQAEVQKLQSSAKL
jgi:hypothetical protein